MKVTIRKFETVELDGDAVREVFQEHLNDLCGGEYTYLRDGRVYDWEDTGHGSGLTEEVKNPSPRQVAALKFREALNDIRRAEADAEEKNRKKAKKRT